MATSLPEDLIAGILCRLPVKVLLRFRSVSKPWRSLIDGQNFIKLHLSTHSDNHRGAIVREERELHWIYLRSPSSAVKLPNPIAGSTELIGSCNGLVVLQNAGGDVALWNPATRKHQRVPIPRATESEFPGLTKLFFNGVFGFGHDPVKDEYKVLRMAVFQCKNGGDDLNTAFRVYTPNTKKWRIAKGTMSFEGCFRRGQAIVRNAVHWLVIQNPSPEKNPSSIVAFDVGAERFREVASPDYGRGGEFDAKLVELRGCLSVACLYGKSGRHVVWMMKDYGVSESWTKLVSVGPAEMGGPYVYVVPVAFVANCGDYRVLFEKDGDVLVLYDIRSKSAEFVRISGYAEVSACVESLVRLDWDGGDSEKEKPKKTEKKRDDDFLSKGFKLKL